MGNETTDRFALPLLSSGQAQKEVTHNEALVLIDMLLHARIESISVSTPPGTTAIGQCWIVAAGGAGDWEGEDDNLACFTSGGWRFVLPRAGMRVSAADNGLTYIYDGSNWALDPVRSDGFYVNGSRVVGMRSDPVGDPAGGSVVDSEARAVLSQLLMVLRGHGLIGVV